MGIAKSHSNPDPMKRKPSKTAGAYQRDKYMEVDEVVDNVYCALVNGESRTKVLQNLQIGEYSKKPITLKNSYEYLNAALNRIAYDKVEKEQEMREMLYARLEEVYRSCMEIGNHMTAISALKEMRDLFIPKTPDTAIQINNSKEGLTVNFGFNNES